jgi:hypothetical protein
MCGKFGSCGDVVWFGCVGYGDLFYCGCLCTLVLVGVQGGGAIYGGFICRLVVICSSFVSRSCISMLVLLWCIHSIMMASVSMRGSLFSFGGMVGSVYVMVFGVKCILTCVSSNLVLYGVSFVVHSLSGIVRIVIVSWFSCAVSLALCTWFFVGFLCCVGGHSHWFSIYVCRLGF